MDLDVLNTDVSIGCIVRETEESTVSSGRSGTTYMVHKELVLSDHVVPTSALTPVVFLDIILDII